jgi:hypothetical protein
MPGHPSPYQFADGREARVSTRLQTLLRRLAALRRRLRDPRTINPFYVFAGGLTVVVPIWLLFLKG